MKWTSPKLMSLITPTSYGECFGGSNPAGCRPGSGDSVVGCFGGQGASGTTGCHGGQQALPLGCGGGGSAPGGCGGGGQP